MIISVCIAELDCWRNIFRNIIRHVSIWLQQIVSNHETGASLEVCQFIDKGSEPVKTDFNDAPILSILDQSSDGWWFNSYQVILNGLKFDRIVFMQYSQTFGKARETLWTSNHGKLIQNLTLGAIWACIQFAVKWQGWLLSWSRIGQPWTDLLGRLSRARALLSLSLTGIESSVSLNSGNLCEFRMPRLAHILELICS